MPKKIDKKEELNSEEYKLKYFEQELEHKKRVYKNYCRCIAEYYMPTAAHGVIYLDDMIHKEIKLSFELARKLENQNVMWDILHQDDDKNEGKSKVEQELEYYDKLISIAEDKIKGFNQDTRIKIVDKWIRAWSSLTYQWEYNDKLARKVAEKEKKDCPKCGKKLKKVKGKVKISTKVKVKK